MTALDVDPDRAARAAEALSTGDVTVEREEPGTYRVRSFSRDRSYRVTLNGSRRCTCPDYQYTGTEVCKHVVATALMEGIGG